MKREGGVRGHAIGFPAALAFVEDQHFQSALVIG